MTCEHSGACIGSPCIIRVLKPGTRAVHLKVTDIVQKARRGARKQALYKRERAQARKGKP
jgi:hypothetical protein